MGWTMFSTCSLNSNSSRMCEPSTVLYRSPVRWPPVTPAPSSGASGEHFSSFCRSGLLSSSYRHPNLCTASKSLHFCSYRFGLGVDMPWSGSQPFWFWTLRAGACLQRSLRDPISTSLPFNNNISIARHSRAPSSVSGRAGAIFPPSRDEGFLAFYERSARESPVITNSITSFIGAAIGDIIAQAGAPVPFDIFRFLRMSTFGLLLAGKRCRRRVCMLMYVDMTDDPAER